MDDLPADVTTGRKPVYVSEIYRDRWARLDTDGRRELLVPVVTVTIGSATARTRDSALRQVTGRVGGPRDGRVAR